MAFNKFPDESISPSRIRVEEISLPSSALIIGTVIMINGCSFLLERVLLISDAFRTVSVLTTIASTTSEVTVGPYSVSSLVIS